MAQVPVSQQEALGPRSFQTYATGVAPGVKDGFVYKTLLQSVLLSSFLYVRFHFIRELITNGVVPPEYHPTLDMPSALMSLPRTFFSRLRPAVVGLAK